MEFALKQSILNQIDSLQNRGKRSIGRAEVEASINDLYRICGLEPPRLIMVSSPYVAVLAGGLATGIWHLREDKARRRDYEGRRDFPDHIDEWVRMNNAGLDWEMYTGAFNRATKSAEKVLPEVTRQEIYELTKKVHLHAGYDYARNAANNVPDELDQVIRRTVKAATDADPSAAVDYRSEIAGQRKLTIEVAEIAYEATANRLAASLSDGDMILQEAMSAHAKHMWHTLMYLDPRGANWTWNRALIDFGETVIPDATIRERYLAFRRAYIACSELVMHKEFCLVSDFAKETKLEHIVCVPAHKGATPRQFNQLHCEDGPAILWRDGAAVYSWHGVEANGPAIEAPRSLSIKEILNHPLAQTRLVMIERYGIDDFFAGAKEIDTAGSRELYRFDFEGGESIFVVSATDFMRRQPDGTAKVYWLRVPASARSPSTTEEAIELAEREYTLTIQTSYH